MTKGFAVYNTDVGQVMIGYDNDSITYLKKVKETLDDMGTPTELTDRVHEQLIEYFNGRRKQFDFKYIMTGTDFQKKVWQALCDIPYGETRTYKQIAEAVGNPKASRAVGMANNKNPISIAVPCHRVIGSNGRLVGYAGGLGMKEFLLNLEAENR